MKHLEQITKIPAVSGYETMGEKAFFTLFEKIGLIPQTDAYGNIFAEKKSAFSQRHILIDSHIDEIGLVVTEVLENGFLSFETVGGVDKTNLLCQEVVVYGTSPIYGVIGAMPPHLTAKEQEKKEKTLLIDTGLNNVEDMVSPGAPVKLKSHFLKLKNGQFSGGAMDDRAGLLVALTVAKKWRQNIDLTVLGSTREEMGLQGVDLFLQKHTFDLAIVLDVTHGYFDGLDPCRSYAVGGGLTLCYGGVLENRLTRTLERALQKEQIPYHTEFEPSHPGTNAYSAVMHQIPVVMMSIPLKYMHTTVETLSEKDVKNLIGFLTGFDWEQALY